MTIRTGTHSIRPLIVVTCDLQDGRCQASRNYADMVAAAGGLPVMLPCLPALAEAYVAQCDGLIFTGGDDPDMAEFGAATHPKATPIHPDRQAFEMALLRMLDRRPEAPVLGICLGMQLMGLHAGAELDQHLADTVPTYAQHWGKAQHEIDGALGRGVIHSHHRQALRDPGSLEVIARAPDGVIEAVRDARRPFHLGVQWHPERTSDERFGLDLFRQLVAVAQKFKRAAV